MKTKTLLITLGALALLATLAVGAFANGPMNVNFGRFGQCPMWSGDSNGNGNGYGRMMYGNGWRGQTQDSGAATVQPDQTRR